MDNVTVETKDEGATRQKSPVDLEVNILHPQSSADIVEHENSMVAPILDFISPASDALDSGVRKDDNTSIKPEFDEELLARYLSGNIRIANDLVVSMIDLGGQSKFDSFRYMLMTNCAVYFLVFSMEKMIGEESACLEELKYWFNSIVVHTYNNESKKMPRVFFIGTFKDRIDYHNVHSSISLTLEREFRSHVGWPFRVPNEDMHFFPVDNTRSGQDDSIKRIKTVIETFSKTHEDFDFVRLQVPMSWLKCLDQLKETGESLLSLSRVSDVCISCGILMDQINLFLRCMHKMSSITWMEEEHLRDAVILEPISFFIPPAGMIVCELTSPDGSTPLHETEVHRQCQGQMHEEYSSFINNGIISDALIRRLLHSTCSGNPEHMSTVVRLMAKFGLLVPIQIASRQNVADDDHIIPGVQKYIVPAQLPPVNLTAFAASDQWKRDSYHSCWFWFSHSRSLHKRRWITSNEMKIFGFLTPGIFQRLVSMATSHCLPAIADETFFMNDLKLHQNMVILKSGRQIFRLVFVEESNSVRLDVLGPR